MFWIVFIIVFLVLCTGWALLVRSRDGGGGGSRGEVTGVDNHNALQNGSARAYRQNISGRAGPSK